MTNSEQKTKTRASKRIKEQSADVNQVTKKVKSLLWLGVHKFKKLVIQDLKVSFIHLLSD